MHEACTEVYLYSDRPRSIWLQFGLNARGLQWTRTCSQIDCGLFDFRSVWCLNARGLQWTRTCSQIEHILFDFSSVWMHEACSEVDLHSDRPWSIWLQFCLNARGLQWTRTCSQIEHVLFEFSLVWLHEVCSEIERDVNENARQVYTV